MNLSTIEQTAREISEIKRNGNQREINYIKLGKRQKEEMDKLFQPVEMSSNSKLWYEVFPSVMGIKIELIDKEDWYEVVYK